ncbi:hypothetical protein MUK72_08435 [Halococcus dombrowskii]|uniref:Halobacterial output domain-containing protein n=1 Tax=Halococcus dombrowskii TaxID=179637 RepID=A0AAV3SI60_HALDO|nr:hypothetical protein [Halococcus dombrowskii]UOO93997.1 hypothetical protein MUK72_08435 [Halococcus dombrowskii]
MTEEPSFAIPRRPERRYSRHAGLEYEGSTVFSLSPAAKRGEQEDEALDELLQDVLDGDPYTYGDWFDLPMALYLVHDTETGDVFRVSIRDGRIEFHVLPETDPDGLRALYRRLAARSEREWIVESSTDA